MVINNIAEANCVLFINWKIYSKDFIRHEIISTSNMILKVIFDYKY